MELEDARRDIEALVSAWYAARIQDATAKKHVQVNIGGFDNAASTAHSVALKLHTQLIDSDGIDAHKEAAAIAYAVGQHFNLIIQFASASSKYTEQRYKDSARADCAMSVFLSMLDVDRLQIEQEPVTYETIRALFLQVSVTKFPHETLTAILIAMSSLAFMLERVYPQPENDCLSD